jgi:integrase/recombinase XerD
MARRGKARVPTPAEHKRLSTVVSTGKHGRRNTALLALSYRAGLRAKELAALTVEHVLDEQDNIRDECSLTEDMTKGGRPRIVFLTSVTIRQALKDYLTHRRAREDILFNRCSALFRSQKGGHFTPNTMQQLLHRLHASAGIVGGRSHSGRRWFATELISKGIDLKAVSTLMGHSSVAMTAQYADDNPQRLRRIVQGLG